MGAVFVVGMVLVLELFEGREHLRRMTTIEFGDGGVDEGLVGRGKVGIGVEFPAEVVNVLAGVFNVLPLGRALMLASR
jgi:hypothetical protein